MVTVGTKLLLLAGLLLGSIDNAVSLRDNKFRGLQTKGTSVTPPSPKSKSGKSESGKSGKGGSGKSGKSTVPTEKSDTGKGGKALHVGSDLTVEYTLVEHSGKSSKSQPTFEYIETGQKTDKSSKEVHENGSDGDESGKTAKSGGNGSTKEAKAGSGMKSDGEKSSKEAKSGGVSAGSTKEAKASKDGAPSITPPAGSPPPTEIGTFGVGVPIYSLVYKLASKSEPTTEELVGLKEATESYLDGFFTNEFDEDDFTIYSQFITDIDGVTERRETQVVVSYDSIVRFGQLSLIKPMPEQLGSAIEEAFTGLRMIQYEDWLTKMLPEGNVFVGSKCQYYHGDGVSNPFRMGWTAIAASAAAMTLLVAGVVVYKSKKNDPEIDIDKLNKSPGDMTVAGETFTGDTYDGTGSVSATSMDYDARVEDEEEGTNEDNIGLIAESDDSDALQPTWNDPVETEGRGGIFRLAPRKIFSAFKSSAKSAPRTSSFEDVALQAPTYGERYQDNIMPDPSSSDDDESQMSDSELSQFVANQTSGGHTLEIKSILSQDSADENNTGDLSVRDNSSRRMRTVAEIEAMLSSELKDDSGSRSFRSIDSSRPRTVEEIESLLSADDDDSVVELPLSEEEGGTIEEC
eukprot:CAMPEP_0116143994 /NCGR_PEP_ID=MMETSP0329-20121206/15747_1 /TAXON_ID=697910 /ORGANISM="Pseudo-nitzschia arenysensis, Strain B593" /LENGTH=629 /DNA_ID=CAMNT_0003639351 /DNA_START=92 /DNA_END=1981 /DNA_ORIENTATION=-